MSKESISDLLAREAVEAEERADAEERGDVSPAPGQRAQRRANDPSQVYAVRIPTSRLRELREVADQLGIPPTTLIRSWVLDRLDAHRQPTDPQPGNTKPTPLGAGSLKPGEVRLGPRRQYPRRIDDGVTELDVRHG
ncbi:MAG: hypothetical protein L0I76_26710 [Pseudonocardia sp.]|nr:hypothetical protein [Pseudonocardia sp.]